MRQRFPRAQECKRILDLMGRLAANCSEGIQCGVPQRLGPLAQHAEKIAVSSPAVTSEAAPLLHCRRRPRSAASRKSVHGRAMVAGKIEGRAGSCTPVARRTHFRMLKRTSRPAASMASPGKCAAGPAHGDGSCTDGDATRPAAPLPSTRSALAVVRRRAPVATCGLVRRDRIGAFRR